MHRLASPYILAVVVLMGLMRAVQPSQPVLLKDLCDQTCSYCVGYTQYSCISCDENVYYLKKVQNQEYGSCQCLSKSAHSTLKGCVSPTIQLPSQSFVTVLFWISFANILLITVLSKNVLYCLFFIETFQSISGLLYIHRENEFGFDGYLSGLYDIHFNFVKFKLDEGLKYVHEKIYLSKGVNYKILFHEDSYLLAFNGAFILFAQVVIFLLVRAIPRLRQSTQVIMGIAIYVQMSELLVLSFFQIQNQDQAPKKDAPYVFSILLLVAYLAYALLFYLLVLYRFSGNLRIRNDPNIDQTAEELLVSVKWQEIYKIRFDGQRGRWLVIFILTKKFVISAVIVGLSQSPTGQVVFKFLAETFQLGYIALLRPIEGRVTNVYILALSLFQWGIYLSFLIVAAQAKPGIVEQGGLQFILVWLLIFLISFLITSFYVIVKYTRQMQVYKRKTGKISTIVPDNKSSQDLQKELQPPSQRNPLSELNSGKAEFTFINKAEGKLNNNIELNPSTDNLREQNSERQLKGVQEIQTPPQGGDLVNYQAADNKSNTDQILSGNQVAEEQKGENYEIIQIHPKLNRASTMIFSQGVQAETPQDLLDDGTRQRKPRKKKPKLTWSNLMLWERFRETYLRSNRQIKDVQKKGKPSDKVGQ